jgi:transposase
MKSFAQSRGPIHLGLDVHKLSITAGVLEANATTPVLQRIGSDDAAVRQLISKCGDPGRLRACYEAGPTGFTLARTLKSWGVACDVVAPSRIPKESGDRIKTDKRDAAALAVLHRAGMLTPIHVPAPEIEAVRDLARARHDLDDDLKRVRRRLLALLLRHGHVYRAGTTWTQAHHQWLDALRFSEPAERQTFEYYRSVMAIREQQLAAISTDLRAWLDKPPIGQAAHRLAAYHAVGYLGGLTIAAEVANEWERFAQARSFMAFTGLVPSEHSSGDRRRQGAITKSGNVVIRTQLIESAWHFRGRPVAGKTLQERQSHVGPATVARASVAHQRLAGRYRRLTARGLPPNVINVAIARELAGFMWAEMTSPD